VEPAECHFRATCCAVPAVDALKRSAKPGVLLAADGEDIDPAADCREVDRVVPLRERALLLHAFERSRRCPRMQLEGLVIPHGIARKFAVPVDKRARARAHAHTHVHIAAGQREGGDRARQVISPGPS